MTNFFKILGIGLGFVFLFFLISTQMVTSGQDNLSQDNLTNAVRAATLDARDQSSRIDRGTYVIDKQKFNRDLGNMSIKSYGGKKLQYNRDFNVAYLQDKNTTISSHPNSNFEPIKAVSVKVHLDPQLQHKTNDKQNTHVITDVIQTPSKNTASDYPNDLTR